MRKIARVVAPLFLAAAVTFVPATPAQAADASMDVANLKASNLVVKSAKCANVKTSVDYAIHDDSMAELYAVLVGGDVWRGSKHADVAVMFSETEATSGTLRGNYKWCPSHGFGTFKLNNVIGAYIGFDASDEVIEQYFNHANTATFTVKMGTKFTSAKIAKKGKTRTISAKATYFNTGSKSWKVLAKGTKVQLQQQAASGAGDWKSIKTVKVGAKGAVKTTYKTSTTYRYRLAYAGMSTKAPSYSSILKK